MKEPEVSTQGIYDYAEAVESGSTLSTPNSTNHEPFASEFLGETVIHLDKVGFYLYNSCMKVYKHTHHNLMMAYNILL